MAAVGGQDLKSVYLGETIEPVVDFVYRVALAILDVSNASPCTKQGTGCKGRDVASDFEFDRRTLFVRGIELVQVRIQSSNRCNDRVLTPWVFGQSLKCDGASYEPMSARAVEWRCGDKVSVVGYVGESRVGCCKLSVSVAGDMILSDCFRLRLYTTNNPYPSNIVKPTWYVKRV